MFAAGPSGIVVGEGERRPRLSEEMLAAVDGVGFPVMGGAQAVSFAQYVRFVAAANARGEDQSFTQVTPSSSTASVEW